MIKTHQVCFWCGIEFIPGGLAYQVRIQMAADFDGYIDGDSLDASPESGLEAIKEALKRTAEELTEEVYRERIILLCKSCAEQAWVTMTNPHPRG